MTDLVSRIPLFLLSLPTLLALCACNGENSGKAASAQTVANTPIAGNPGAKPTRPDPSLPLGSGFDFYVLSLSWSPTWCIENDPAGRSDQCAAENTHGFIVHGLWPQNETGYPEFCRSRDAERVPDALGRTLFDIMPSMGLIGHEWRKHGSCSGLGQKDYFAVLRAAREKIAIPQALRDVRVPKKTSAAEMEALLVSVNPGLKQDALAVTCTAGRVDEVRICFDKSLNFRSCGEIDRSGCKAKNLDLPKRPRA